MKFENIFYRLYPSSTNYVEAIDLDQESCRPLPGPAFFFIQSLSRSFGHVNGTPSRSRGTHP